MDTSFQQRLAAGLAKEAKGKGTTDLPALILRNPAEGARVFMPFIASEPGFDTAYASGGQEMVTDQMLLSGMQANWNTVSNVYFPPTEPA